MSFAKGQRALLISDKNILTGRGALIRFEDICTTVYDCSRSLCSGMLCLLSSNFKQISGLCHTTVEKLYSIYYVVFVVLWAPCNHLSGVMGKSITINTVSRPGLCHMTVEKLYSICYVVFMIL